MNTRKIAAGFVLSFFLSGIFPGLSAQDNKLPKVEKGTNTSAIVDSLHNPAAIFFTRFLEAEPKGSVMPRHELNKWYYRTDAGFMAKDDTVLHVGIGEMPDISYNPRLKGHYNLYVGLRSFMYETGIQLKTDSMKDWATVQVPAILHNEYRNLDILWATNVEMDGRTITLHCSHGTLYFNYLSFVPVEKDNAKTIDNQFVRYEGIRDLSDTMPSGHYERMHRDTRPLPDLASESKKRGYILFSGHWMDLVFPNTKPSRDPGTLRLECSAAQDEFEPVTFNLYALENLGNVTVALENPLISAKSEIPVENVDIRITRHFNKRFSSPEGLGSEYMDAPVYLEANHCHAIPAGTAQQYWLTIHVPEKTPAGTYTGMIRLSAKEKAAESIPLQVTVYPFKLEGLKGYDIGICYRSVPDGESLNDIKDHGMNSLKLCQFSIGPIKGQYPDMHIDFNNSPLGEAMTMMRDHGYDGQIGIHFEAYPIYVVCKRQKLKKEIVDEVYASLIRELLDEAKRQQWPHMFFYVGDELPSNPSAFPMAIHEMALLKQAGAITAQDHLWYKTNRGADIQKNIDSCVKFVDIFELRYSGKPLFYVDSWENIIQRVKQENKKLYHYNINNGLAFPEMATMRFGLGWFFRTVGDGCSGHILWGYQEGAGSVYNDFDGPTDWIQQYPPSKKHNTLGGPALYWEAMREGVDDLKYILTLENLMDKYKNDSRTSVAISNAKKLLSEIKGSFNLEKLKNECQFLESKWEKSQTLADGRRIAEGQFNLPNGWTFEKYDEARRAIADAIVKIICAANH